MFSFLSKNKKRRVHFLHIGKTGGTALKAVLQDFMETREYVLKLHGHSTNLKGVPKGDFVVFFLRDPVSRFISGFYSRQRKGRPRYYVEWNSVEKKVFKQFSTPNELAVALADKQSSKHALAVTAMARISHFKPYNKWYIDLDYFKSRYEDILFIGFQESLAADFIRLKNILGVPVDKNLPTDVVGAHRNPGNVDRSMSDSALSVLREWYAEDFKFISLCREIMSELYIN